MTKIVSRPLPHGRVPFDGITNPELKKIVMLLNDNIVTLQLQLETAQNAIIELQRRK